jgi:alkylated DNA repair dioxygenase AlkB
VDGAERLELDERSWVDVSRGFLDDADSLYAELVDTAPWRGSRVYRYDHWVEEPRLSAWFRANASAPPRLLEVHRQLQRAYGVTFDGFALNWYRDGRDGQAFHRDRDMQWLDETVIAILTLGATRPWLLRPRANRYAHDLPDKGAVLDFAPASGDLLVMGGATQAGWEHSVAQVRRPVAGRISVQWRWTSRRGRQERGGSYSKPRHYSRH